MPAPSIETQVKIASEGKHNSHMPTTANDTLADQDPQAPTAS